MIILDTSVWIEFLKGKGPYFTAVKTLLENRQILAMECVFGELLQGAKNKRERETIVLYWNNLPKINDEEIWIEAGEYSSAHRRISKGVGLIDCVIIVAARRENARIWSIDKKLNFLLKKEEKYVI